MDGFDGVGRFSGFRIDGGTLYKAVTEASEIRKILREPANGGALSHW
jgi:hypothetical protein